MHFHSVNRCRLINDKCLSRFSLISNDSLITVLLMVSCTYLTSTTFNIIVLHCCCIVCNFNKYI